MPCLAPAKYQDNYDALVSLVGCNKALNTFECLRTLDRDLLINATNVLYSQSAIYGSRVSVVFVPKQSLIHMSSLGVLPSTAKLSLVARLS